MFDSGISAKQLLEELKSEIDVAIPISDNSYIRWLNSTEQLLYSEFIHDMNVITFSHVPNALRYNPESDGVIVDIIGMECELPKAPDIISVYCGDKQLIRTTYEKLNIFPDTYCIYRNKEILVNTEDDDGIKMYFYARPKLKTAENLDTLNIMLPIEFIEIVSAKIRGEAYKLANEDVLSAKWLNDYNVLLENFKVWLINRDTGLGTQR